MLTWTMLVSLPVVFLALAAQLSASEPDAGSSASRAFKRPGTTLISGRLFEEHSLLPIDVADYDEIWDSRRKRAILQEALDSVLPLPLIEIAGGYSCASRSRQFAEALYTEFFEGRTNLLCGELFDAEKGVLRKSHHFWDYLGSGVERVVVFVHMLSIVRFHNPEMKEGLKDFALLVGERVAQTAYFVAGYLYFSTQLAINASASMPFPLANTSFDEWPQVLVEDPRRLLGAERTLLCFAAALQCFLVQRDLERAARYISIFGQSMVPDDNWFFVFHTLYAAEPALVRTFFDAAILLGRSLCTLVLETAAPVAMGVDPTLGKYLVAMANKFNLAVPVAVHSVRMEELADDEKAGGNVHVRLLTVMSKARAEFWYRASSTRKTVAHSNGVQLHVAAGNFLDARSTFKRRHLYVHNFEQDKVRGGELAPGRSLKESVQHGDVVVVCATKKCPAFLKAKMDCAGLSRSGCFESVKSFCCAARDRNVEFMAIVESDSAINAKDGLLEAMKRLQVGRKAPTGAGTSCKQQSKNNKESRQRASLAITSCRNREWVG